MKILIDADGCPVVDQCIQTGREVVLVCDSAHWFEREGAKTVIVSTGPDSADFALVNLAKKGDLVVTQDYGLAAMCLAKRTRVLNQDGMEYTDDNIEALLLSRHTSRKIRRAGGRLKGPPKRTAKQDADFIEALNKVLVEVGE
ncbi:MAG: DUF188 domain-containing protein [Clostridia bacterium]